MLYGSNNIQEESCSEFGDLIELKAEMLLLLFMLHLTQFFYDFILSYPCLKTNKQQNIYFLILVQKRSKMFRPQVMKNCDELEGKKVF